MKQNRPSLPETVSRARSALRDELNTALDHIYHLQRGLGMACVPVTDKGQLDQLLRAQRAILDALKLEESL